MRTPMQVNVPVTGHPRIASAAARTVAWTAMAFLGLSLPAAADAQEIETPWDTPSPSPPADTGATPFEEPAEAAPEPGPNPYPTGSAPPVSSAPAAVDAAVPSTAAGGTPREPGPNPYPKPAARARTEVTLKGDDRASFYLEREGRFEFVCAHECTLSLRPGQHRLALGRDLNKPAVKGLVTVGPTPLTLYGRYQEADNAVAWTALGIGIGAALVSAPALVIAADEDDQVGIPIALIAGGALLTGIALCVALYRGDKASLDVGRVSF